MNSSLKNYLNDTNIIIVIDSLDGGGAESQAIKLANGLKKENINITLFPLRSGGVLTKHAKDLDIELIEGDLRSSRNIKSFVRGFILLCKTIRLKNPAIVHSFLPFSNFIGWSSNFFVSLRLILNSEKDTLLYL